MRYPQHWCLHIRGICFDDRSFHSATEWQRQDPDNKKNKNRISKYYTILNKQTNVVAFHSFIFIQYYWTSVTSLFRVIYLGIGPHWLCCAECFWFMKKNQLIRVIWLRIWKHFYAVVSGFDSLERIRCSGNQTTLVAQYVFDSLKRNGSLESFFSGIRLHRLRYTECFWFTKKYLKATWLIWVICLGITLYWLCCIGCFWFTKRTSPFKLIH